MAPLQPLWSLGVWLVAGGYSPQVFLVVPLGMVAGMEAVDRSMRDSPTKESVQKFIYAAGCVLLLAVSGVELQQLFAAGLLFGSASAGAWLHLTVSVGFSLVAAVPETPRSIIAPISLISLVVSESMAFGHWAGGPAAGLLRLLGRHGAAAFLAGFLFTYGTMTPVGRDVFLTRGGCLVWPLPLLAGGIEARRRMALLKAATASSLAWRGAAPGLAIAVARAVLSALMLLQHLKGRLNRVWLQCVAAVLVAELVSVWCFHSPAV